LLAGREAVAALEQALMRADEACALGVAMQEMEWQGLALHDRGLALALLGREQKGLAAFQEALDLWEQIGDLQSAGYAHRFVARRFHEAAGRLAEAETAYDQALRAFERIGDVESQAFTAMDKARVASRQGRPEQAADLYEAAIARLEVVRAKAGFPEFRKAFMGKVYDRYEEAAQFALSQGLDERALGYVERMKARTFLDQLAEARVDLHKGIDPALKAQRDGVEADLAGATDEIAAEYRKPSPDPKALAAIQARMTRLSTELERIKKQIRLQNPRYASVEYPQPVTVAELQGRVLSRDEVLIEYFVGTREVYCFVVTREVFKAVRLAGSAPALQDRVAALVDNLNAGLGRGEGYDRPAAGELYDILLKPIENEMADRTLVIVPDGLLALLPFEALVVRKEGRRSYLFERHAIKYVPSATIMALLSSEAGVSAKEGFIGFGDPVYDYNSYTAGRPEGDAELTGRGILAGAFKTRYAALGGRLSRLEGSGEEVRAIERLFREKSGGKALLREKAREEIAKGAGMDQYGYIHFSMHGIVSPGLQAIAFSQIPGTGEDGLLTMGEMMNLRFDARLVVLSACRTGLGKVERGEGVTGLTRAVLYAGSPAAVVSLWSVDDTATRELMTRFYEGMIVQGEDKSEALRAAKGEMLRTRYRHPYFWAAFVMYGE
jgi:CHAT domain-containing protein